MLIGQLKYERRDRSCRCKQRRRPLQDDEMNIGDGGGGGKLGVVIRPDFRVAASHPGHAAAIAVHRAAADAFLAGHRVSCHAGEHWRCGREQEEDREAA